MKRPKISLVTCSFQQGKFIEQTIQSVLRQGYDNMEYLVIDGGSTDQTIPIVQKYRKNLAYWISEQDEGQADALIKGFERATGEIHGWLCSDDLLMPGALEAVGNFFADHPEVDFIYGDALWIDVESRPIRLKLEPAWNRFVFLYDHNYLPQPSCFWRSSIYRAVGGLDSRLHYSMDSDLWLRFARVTRPVHLPKVLSSMRLYPEQKCSADKLVGRSEHAKLRFREMPNLSILPLAVLRPLARCVRIVQKLAIGAYGSRPPEFDI